MKYYITTAIDYSNGKPHIGHSHEKIAADVLARYYRLQGANVYFLTGTNEHGLKIARNAQLQNKSEQQYVDENAADFENTWKALDISFDRFIRTTDLQHIRSVEEIVQRMKDNGYLYEGEYTGLYCVGHEGFIDEKDLVDGLCPEHQTSPELITEKNWSFKVSAFAGTLRHKIETEELRVWPQYRKEEVLNLLENGVEDVAITRPTVSWGIQVPWDRNQTIYVWIDALISHVSGAGFGADNDLFQEYWPADIHLIGKDILKYQCITWPAMLLAAGLSLPKSVLVHGHLAIDGLKVSNSHGNVIDPNDWISKYGADAVRYFIMREFPFGEDGDVSEEKLKARYNSELVDQLSSVIVRVTDLIEKHFDGMINTSQERVSDLEDVDTFVRQYKFDYALALIFENIKEVSKYLDEQKPWDVVKNDSIEADMILSRAVAQLLVIAYKLAPFMPETAEKIRLAFETEQVVKIEPLFK